MQSSRSSRSGRCINDARRTARTLRWTCSCASWSGRVRNCAIRAIRGPCSGGRRRWSRYARCMGRRSGNAISGGATGWWIVANCIHGDSTPRTRVPIRYSCDPSWQLINPILNSHNPVLVVLLIIKISTKIMPNPNPASKRKLLGLDYQSCPISKPTSVSQSWY